VTGHKYKISWGQVGLDWEGMKMDISKVWGPRDDPIYFVHNFTDVRVDIETFFNGELVANDSVPLFARDYRTG